MQVDVYREEHSILEMVVFLTTGIQEMVHSNLSSRLWLKYPNFAVYLICSGGSISQRRTACLHKQRTQHLQVQFDQTIYQIFASKSDSNKSNI